MTTKPLAKSLHTVSVLVNLSRYFMADAGHLPNLYRNQDEALRKALLALKLDSKPDQYGLVEAARTQLRGCGT